MGGAKKGGKKKSSEHDFAVEEEVRAPLQAILLAENNFAEKFHPITTLECPKVLLPLLNTAMIDHTLSWLQDAGIQKVIVICCSHSDQISDHLKKRGWVDQPNFSVTTINADNCTSAGDALREMHTYHRDKINGDFVLVSGDTVSNMDLKQALEQHKERGKKKDSNAVMTMVIKNSQPSQVTRFGTDDELIMAIDSSTKQLLYYEDDPKAIITLDKSFLAENPSKFLHNDKQECYIDICSPKVVSLFKDNPDWGDLHGDFVKGLLLHNDVMDYKIFTHEIPSHYYADRIHDFRSYDSISRDIIQRPDVHTAARLKKRNAIYQGSEISQSGSAEVGPFTCIGKGSSIGNNTEISNSVVGFDCKIGDNVSIDGCYVWNNVTIEDGCKLNHAILCDGVVMKSGAVLQPGVVLSYNVVVGREFVVPAYSKVSLRLPQPEDSDDEELEYSMAKSHMGHGGCGFIWSTSCSKADHEEWKHSMAPIPAEKLIELTQAFYDDLDIAVQDNPLPYKGESSTESDDDFEEEEVLLEEEYFEEEEVGVGVEEIMIKFEEEVEAIFLLAVENNFEGDNLRMLEMEINVLKCDYARDHHNVTVNCASALFYSMMNLALREPRTSPAYLVNNADGVISRWGKVLKQGYLRSLNDEIEVILRFEEMCLEPSSKEYAPLFAEILYRLYDKSIIQEEAIHMWAQEKENADESDNVFLKKSEKFIQWLNEASEEEEED